MKKVLTIAGSDSSGGAGIQADIKAMTVNGVYAMSAITALTAQNTMGVEGIAEVTPSFLKQQIDSVFEDIFPDGVKIGMVSSEELVEVIAERLVFYKAKNIVVDPVMVATSGAQLIKENTALEKLLHIADVITPNLFEAEVLTGNKINSSNDMLCAAKNISEKYQTAVFLKGGHCKDNANDLLYFNDTYKWIEGMRINNPNTHGTGCTLSSTIAANLAKGYSLEDSVSKAKDYITRAISANLNLGRGRGPLNHMV